MSSEDDLFHDIIMSEEISQKLGYEEGLSVGKLAGIQEGNRLGWEKGAGIGSEVGFYLGFAQELLDEFQGKPDSKPRVIKTLERLVTLVRLFPLTEPLNPELQTKMEEIRTKFKQVSSLLGIKAETPNRSDRKGISF